MLDVFYGGVKCAGMLVDVGLVLKFTIIIIYSLLFQWHEPQDLSALRGCLYRYSCPTYDSQIDDPIQQQGNKEKEPFHRNVNIFHGTIIKILGKTEPILNYEVTIFAATPTHSWSMLIIYTMLTCPPMSDKISTSCSHPYAKYPKPMPNPQTMERNLEENKASGDGKIMYLSYPYVPYPWPLPIQWIPQLFFNSNVFNNLISLCPFLVHIINIPKLHYKEIVFHLWSLPSPILV